MNLKDYTFYGKLNLLHMMGLAVLIKLWLVSAQPILATFTPHDDLLFLILAENLLNGNWLGEFNNRILIKGVFYPLFIAISNILHIPLLTAQHVFYAAACWLFVVAVKPYLGDFRAAKWLLLGMFLFLLFNAFTYNYTSNGRVMRLGVYPALVILLFSCLLAVLARLSNYIAVKWCVGIGLSLSALWLTREEGVWLLPTLGLFMGGMVLRAWWYREGVVRTFLLTSVLPLSILASSLLAVSYVNYHKYGVFLTNEIKSDEFRHAYSGLLRVKSDHWIAHFPFRQDSREKIYAVSPQFKRLQPYIEGDMGRAWQGGFVDINGGLFMWLLRDAVTEIGYYEHADAKATLGFYQQLGDEIHGACDSGELECETLLHPLTPPWRSEYTEALLPTFSKVLTDIVKFREFSPRLSIYSHTAGVDIVMPAFTYVTNELVRVDHPVHLAKLPDFFHQIAGAKLKVLEEIGVGVYRKLPQILFPLGVIILLVLGFIHYRSRKLDPMMIGSVLLLAGLCGHVAIITIVNITSYDGAFRLGHTDYPLVLMFCVTSLLALGRYRVEKTNR